jgi:hypothetical protein
MAAADPSTAVNELDARPGVVRYGILGSGFVADFYADGLRDVPIARAVANYSRSEERAKAFAARRGIERTYTEMADLCADPEVDVVIIALPNHRTSRPRAWPPRPARASSAPSRSPATPPKPPRWSSSSGTPA